MHYIGIDLALKYSHFCALNDAAEVIEKGRVLTTRPALTKAFAQREHCVICLEAGASSPWVDRLLRELGHEVVVCNPRRVRLQSAEYFKVRRSRRRDTGPPGAC